jgi:hypothetical protein
MPRSAKGPRLWLRPARNDSEGQHAAVWIIKDAGHQQSTGCVAADIAGAERALEQYLNRKHTAAAAKAGSRDPAASPIADVLAFYLEQKAPRHARPKETRQRIGRLADFFGDRTLADLDGELCRAFGKSRGKAPAAREDLIVLRSAINFHREEGRCDRVISVVLPDKRPGRGRWLTRSEAARRILGGVALSRSAERTRDRTAIAQARGALHSGRPIPARAPAPFARPRSRRSRGTVISTQSARYFIGGQRVPQRRRNGGRRFRCPGGFWRT